MQLTFGINFNSLISFICSPFNNLIVSVTQYLFLYYFHHLSRIIYLLFSFTLDLICDYKNQYAFKYFFEKS